MTDTHSLVPLLGIEFITTPLASLHPDGGTRTAAPTPRLVIGSEPGCRQTRTRVSPDSYSGVV